jgi:uncharacterized protein YuzE
MEASSVTLAVQEDREHDQLYIALQPHGFEPGAVRETIRINDDVAVDFDANGALLGIDVMNVSIVLGAFRDRT